MPGMLYHLFFGKVVLDGMKVVKGLKIPNEERFMAGNIIPDLATNKHDAHYYRQGESGFYQPNLPLARRALAEVPDQSLRLGLGAHFYLDNRFTGEFIAERSELDPRTKIVQNLVTGKCWSLEDFYSPKGLYHGFGECNNLLLRDQKISLEWIRQHVPSALPETHIAALDARGDHGWHQQLDWYLEDPPAYTGRILVYGELVDFIQKCASDFTCRDFRQFDTA